MRYVVETRRGENFFPVIDMLKSKNSTRSSIRLFETKEEATDFATNVLELDEINFKIVGVEDGK